MNALTYEFEGATLTQLEIDGRPAWVAQEVGTALGYSDGRRLVDTIRNRWRDEFVEGVDYALLEGAMLESLKRLNTGLVFSSHTRALLVLFETGLHLALVKTPKEAGRRLRRFLVTEILPKLVRGEGIDASSLDARREARLAERQEAQLAKWAFQERVTKAEALRRVVEARHAAGEIDSVELAAWLAYIAEVVHGSDIPLLRGPIPSDWSTPTQIGLRLGVTAHRVGRIITRLGLRQSRGGWARPRVFERNGRPITAWLYSPHAEALIAAELERA